MAQIFPAVPRTPNPPGTRMPLRRMEPTSDRLLEQCSIALVGKYTKFSDSYASVIKALEHSALAISHKLDVKYVDSADLEPGMLQDDPVNPELKGHFEKKGFHFVGEDVDGERMEVIELDDHPYFVGVQYHPEFTSRPIKPSPPYFGLLLAATGKLQSYLQKGCRLSPR
ncbi:hypothetical protein CRUP_022147 [Coryphaenoides rupestris]|nr:hypothetical protein CRUP_022147 [Coryphaenoides rupestris]